MAPGTGMMSSPWGEQPAEGGLRRGAADLSHDGFEGPYECEVAVDVLNREPGPAQPVVPFGQLVE
ncbi:hypothetical protein GCM10018779_67600 [Streptomyces griseocarneus]|nr:hypothetical protein GCM10018779_67600 [Streptomyces griseocarneus]